MYQASVPPFLHMLKNLSAILGKAEAFAAEHKIEPEVLLSWRLAPDMFPLVRQVQIAADFAKGTTARLAGAEVPKYADDEKTFAELKARIAKTVKFVQDFSAKDIDGSEGRDITLTVGGQERDAAVADLAAWTAEVHAQGYKVLHAATASEALRMCATHRSRTTISPESPS